MVLIADGGSTKTNWCLLSGSGEKLYFNTEGYNPFFVDTLYIVDSLKNGLPKELSPKAVEHIYYYGAGVHNKEKAAVISDALKQVFPQAHSEVSHDLLAAARALLGNKAGFAAILGTGTNTCIYDGKEIVLNISSAAYILGDEGSGCYIGKKVLTDYIRGYMPEDVHKAFWEKYKLTSDQVMSAVYSQPLANRFCAGFSKFCSDEEVDSDYSRALVSAAFDDFFNNLVIRYPHYQDYSFNCIGSVAHEFSTILSEKVAQYGMQMGRIVRSPIEDLVQYHLSNSK